MGGNQGCDPICARVGMQRASGPRCCDSSGSMSELHILGSHPDGGALRQAAYMARSASTLSRPVARVGQENGGCGSGSGGPLTNALPHLLPADTQDFGTAPKGDTPVLQRPSHELRQSGFHEVVPGEALRLAGAAPVPGELALSQSGRLVGVAQRASEVPAMLDLERSPDIARSSPGLDQPVEHGLVTHGPCEGDGVKGRAVSRP